VANCAGLLSLEVMRAWCKEDTVRGQRMQQALVDAAASRDGRFTFEQLEAVLQAIAPGLPPRTARKVWSDAQRDSCSGDGHIEAEAVAAAARNHGVGALPHLLPLVGVVAGGHDDMAFLRGSWAQLRPAVSARVTEGEGQAEAALEGLVGELDACVAAAVGEEGAVEATEAAWKLYRRVLVACQAHQQAAEVQAREDAHRAAEETPREDAVESELQPAAAVESDVS
jgi:hypothetical protein